MKRFLPEPRTFRLGLNGLIAFSITVSSLNTAPCLIQAKSSAKTCAACANTGILPKEKAESDDTSKTDSKTNTKSDTKTDSEINAADSVRAFGSGLVHFNDLNQSNARQTDLQKHAEGAAENTTQNPDKKQSLEDMRQRKKAVQTACAASAKTRKKETGSASDSRKDDSKTSSTNQDALTSIWQSASSDKDSQVLFPLQEEQMHAEDLRAKAYPFLHAADTPMQKPDTVKKSDTASETECASAGLSSKQKNTADKTAAVSGTKRPLFLARRYLHPVSGQMMLSGSEKLDQTLEQENWIALGSTVSSLDLYSSLVRHNRLPESLMPQALVKNDESDEKLALEKGEPENIFLSAPDQQLLTEGLSAHIAISKSEPKPQTDAKSKEKVESKSTGKTAGGEKLSNEKAKADSKKLTESKKETKSSQKEENSAARKSGKTDKKDDTSAYFQKFLSNSLSYTDASANTSLAGTSFIPGRYVMADASGKLIDVRLDSPSHFVSGEWTTSQGIEYYSPKTHERMASAWIVEDSPRKLCYFDENGYRVDDIVCIDGTAYAFDKQSGALFLDFDQLEREVEKLIGQYRKKGEQIAFALRSVETGQSIVLNSKPQQSASVMKAFVMGAIFDQYDAYCKKWTKRYIDQNLSVMISISDNNAWVNLVTVLGGGDYVKGIKVLNAWNQAHGYADTTMSPVAYGNYTSAKDASQLLADIENGKLKNSGKMKALLETQAVPGRMLQNLPKNVKTGNKPGWVPGCENDTVLVEAPFGSYVITLLCDDMQDTTRATQLMAKLSPMVYEWMKASSRPAK